MSTYYGILTQAGETQEANAHALGIPLKITEMAVGDGGGTLPTPTRQQTALIGPQRRAPLNRLFVDPNNPNWIVAEQVIPENIGGWWIRELGLYDENDHLIAVANCPPTYKPQLSEGAGRTQVIRMVLLVSSVDNFTLKIDPAVVLATRGYVDDGLAGKAALAHTHPWGEITDKPDMATRWPKWGEVTEKPALPLVYSIAALPTSNLGPIIVAEASEVWIWVSSAHYTGYRSPLCGRPVDGHTIVPLASEIDAVGGLLSKSAYAGLWGYAQENSLVVTQTEWAANLGAHWFVDVSNTQFRVPDLRNQFRRYTGTDADSANARGLGTRQGEQLKNHQHTQVPEGNRGISTLKFTAPVGSSSYFVTDGSNVYTGMTGGSETRPINTAYAPRIHV